MDVVAITVALSRRFRSGSTAAVTRSVPTILVSTMASAFDVSQPSAAMSSAREMPALAMRTSSSGKRSPSSPANRATERASATSSVMPTTPGKADMTSSSSPWRRPATIT